MINQENINYNNNNYGYQIEYNDGMNQNFQNNNFS